MERTVTRGNVLPVNIKVIAKKVKGFFDGLRGGASGDREDFSVAVWNAFAVRFVAIRFIALLVFLISLCYNENVIVFA